MRPHGLEVIMNIKDSVQRFREFWNDFRKEKSGLVGLGILGLALLIVIFEPVFLSF
jgi:peptide/nickel transport system permease protein